ncbi:MAG TPA: ABC transporter substrate-binding protein [Mycobacteriales bacterium]|nr:ABC transporter substrate-binding protein [Mycobacteriales bacterium]
MKRRPLAVTIAAAACALSACGTQLSHDRIVADYNGGGARGAAAGTAPDGTGAVPTQAVGAAPTVAGPTTGTGPVTAPTAGAVTGGQPVAVPPAGSVTGAPPAGASTAPTSTRAGGPAPTAGRSGAATAACTTSGAPVVLGQVGTFSGVVGAVFSQAKTALAIWANDINSRGGLACHPVRVVSKDDGGSPANANSAVQDLVKNDHAIAIVGSMVATTVSGLQQGIDQTGVPAVGGDAANPIWTTDPLFRVEGGTFDPSLLGMAHLAALASKPKIGLLYCIEAAICSQSGPILTKGAPEVGAQIVYSASVSITQPSFTAQCQSAKNAGAQSLILGLDSSGVQRLARDCVALDYHPLLITTATALNGPSIADDPNLQGMQTTSRVAPWMQTDTPGGAAFLAAVQRYAPTLAVDEAGAEGWASAKLLEAAVNALGASARGDLTPALIIKGLGLVKNETLGGLSPAITFTAGKASPENPCYYIEVLTNKAWTAPQGSTKICGPAS